MERLIVPRTVTVVDGEKSRSAPLAEFRSARAYVLLGDPGAGKTAAFQTECEKHADGQFVTARRFIRRGPDRLSEWEEKTLFIDGLDEVRAGSSVPRRQLDEILDRLERLGSPKFRLSCRAADWLGPNDLRGIVAEAGYEGLWVLYLEPLTGTDIPRILVDLGVSDVAGFLAEARDRRLEALLHNPQSLGMLAEAIHSGGWPRNLRDTYELACHGLAQSQPMSRSEVNRILAAAGHLSALLLLSDKNVLVLDSTDDPDTLCLSDIDNGDSASRLRAVQSDLFTRRAGGHFVLKHGHQAAFLAARFLHRCIKQDVPVGRVLSLMSGQDGVVVTELRGLSAWLAAFNRSARESLMSTDPLGIALYGDVGGFRKVELRRLLRVLADKADDIRPWNWPPIALASLIKEHSITLLSRYVQDDDRSKGRQTVVGLLLHALSGTSGVRPDVESLERTLRDATWDCRVRRPALRALLHHTGDSASSTLEQLLDDLRNGRVADRDGDLLGTLLNHLYPRHIGPDRIWDYLVPRGRPDYAGTHRMFWSAHLPNRTREKDLVALLGSLRKRGTAFRRQHGDDWVRRMIQELVRRALEASGDRAPASTLYDWLELIDFEEVESSLARTRDFLGVCRWLADRPELQKELVLEGLHRRVGTGDSAPGADTRGAGDREGGGHGRADDAVNYAFQIRGAVFRAGIPADVAAWSLEQAVAKAATNSTVARILLDWSGPWTQDAPESGLSIDEVRVATQDVPVLREEVNLLWEGRRKSEARDAQMRLREEGNEHRQERRRKKKEFITYVRRYATELQSGRCPPVLLHQIGLAYHDIFLDQKAATPSQRVLKLLQGHQDLADAAIEGFRRVLDRNDLPTLREVIRLNERGQMSRYALPILAGLDAMSPNALQSRRPEEIARAAAFYYLTPLNVPGHPAWYRWALDNHSGANRRGIAQGDPVASAETP